LLAEEIIIQVPGAEDGVAKEDRGRLGWLRASCSAASNQEQQHSKRRDFHPRKGNPELLKMGDENSPASVVLKIKSFNVAKPFSNSESDCFQGKIKV
jgi:hypothetical protein